MNTNTNAFNISSAMLANGDGRLNAIFKTASRKWHRANPVWNYEDHVAALLAHPRVARFLKNQV